MIYAGSMIRGNFEIDDNGVIATDAVFSGDCPSNSSFVDIPNIIEWKG